MIKLTYLFILLIIDIVHCDDAQRFAIKTEGCTIPDFEPFNSAINKYVQGNVELSTCNMGRPPLLGSNSTSIYFIKNSMKFYDVVVLDDLMCGYTPFRRILPKWDGQKDNNIEYLQTIYFFSDLNINDEFVMVDCFYQERHIYKDYFAFVPLKSVNSVRGDGDFNVLLMGFDGMSRLNVYRNWKSTKKVLDKLGVEELFGYNKVGGNSFPNLMPLLAGLSYEELKQVCWKNRTSYFDDCSFIWDAYKKNGFVTAHSDDVFWNGLFHANSKGFKKERKTDYLFDYFMAEAESKLGNNKNRNYFDCIGPRETYKVFLSYIEKFLERMSQNRLKFFGNFFETIMSHDDVLKSKNSDQTMSNFFDSKLMKEILQDTILIIYSDHGARFGSFRLTYQGIMEDRLPYISFYFPPSFKLYHKSLYENFKINRHRLTTPYDIHETLLDILQLNNQINRDTPSKYYSLFEKIPENRTCNDANIPLEFCACGYSSKISTVLESIESYKCAFLIISTINKMIPLNKCARLKLEDLVSSRVLNTNGTTKYYTLIIKTSPSNAIFQGTIKVLRKRFILMEEISRLNFYAKDSYCVGDDPELLKYCYCYGLN